MLLITLQEMAVKEKKFILLFRMGKVAETAVSLPVHMEDFVSLVQFVRIGAPVWKDPPLHGKLFYARVAKNEIAGSLWSEFPSSGMKPP